MAYISQYPPTQNDTYVKVTSVGWNCYGHLATDPTKSLIGTYIGTSWLSGGGDPTGRTNQRFHIDLGSGKMIIRIYYENNHASGGGTNVGVQNFTLWGSNSADSFAELTYGTDTGWTELTVSQNTFDEHTASNVADPKYIIVTNSTEYRYYAFKFADNYTRADAMGVRRIELQIEAEEANAIFMGCNF